MPEKYSGKKEKEFWMQEQRKSRKSREKMGKKWVKKSRGYREKVNDLEWGSGGGGGVWYIHCFLPRGVQPLERLDIGPTPLPLPPKERRM